MARHSRPAPRQATTAAPAGVIDRPTPWNRLARLLAALAAFLLIPACCATPPPADTFCTAAEPFVVSDADLAAISPDLRRQLLAHNLAGDRL